MIEVFKKTILLISLLTFFCCSFFTNSFADSNQGIGRVRSCDSDGNPEGLDWNPTFGGKDIEFVLDNPTCIAVIASSYAATKAAITYMNSSCGNKAGVRITPSPLLDSIDILKATAKSIGGNKSCAISLGIASASFATSLAELSIIYSIAKNTFPKAKICGSNWIGPNPVSHTNNRPIEKQKIELAIKSYINSEPTQTDKLQLDNEENKEYREWFYGGIEIEDNPDEGEICYDVNGQRGTDGKYKRQKYYMRGLENGNFNCKRYYVLPGGKDPKDGTIVKLGTERYNELRKAYNCCKNRAANYACIDYTAADINISVPAGSDIALNRKQKFCRVGTNCELNGMIFSVESKDNNRLACVETHSLCPYNFTLEGGSEVCDYYQDGVWDSSIGAYKFIDVASVTAGKCAEKSEIRNADCTYNNLAGKCRNYCQYMRHCTKTDTSNYIYTSNIRSPFFSDACLDFVGDSKNSVSYGTGFIAGNARHFSAPMAQCVKETLENVFYNRAGHTTCAIKPTQANSFDCRPEDVVYEKGDQVNEQSFFSKIQEQMKFIIKLILTLFITFYGVKLLIEGGEIKPSELIMHTIRIGIIIYFATGNAWQTMFFDGVYSASTVVSNMIFKVQTSYAPDNKRDGCQFGNIKGFNGVTISTNEYPKGKEYLAIWDTLDCKLTRYLGYGPEVSTANIVKLILAGWIFGTIGIYFSISLLIFGILLLAAIIRALHIFLSSVISVILMVYISPLIFPTMLFEKTKGIFNGWLTQLTSFILQPMILFAYIAIFVTAIDKTLIGSATFYGTPPFRTIMCDSYCVDNLGNKIKSSTCEDLGYKVKTPRADSIACMISNNYFSNWPGLELIGISLPFIVDFITTGHVREKILTLAKAVLVMYFLIKFMDEIPGITSALIGGSALKGSKADGIDMFKKAAGLTNAIRKRAGGMARKGVKLGAKRAGQASGAIGDIAKNLGDKGKSAENTSGDKEQNNDDAKST